MLGKPSLSRSANSRALPLATSAAIAVVDQLIKHLVMARLRAFESSGDRIPLVGDLLALIRTQNTGIAFGLGQALPEPARRVLVVFLPLAVVIAAIVMFFRSTTLSGAERWSIALVAGGGTGNLIDRVFRPDGVVDFVQVGVSGLFGRDYFSVFNFADVCITAGAVLFVVGTLVSARRASHASQANEPESESHDRT
jgi:signal peptidase II